MTENKADNKVTDARNSPTLVTAFTRRQAIAGTGIALGTLAAASTLWGSAQQQPSKEAQGSTENQKRTSLHQEVDLKASPQRIYEVLLDSKQFSACSGMPAEIDPKAGGAFSMFGAMIVGRTIELIPNQRIVQAWRPTHWDQGIYSLVKFELKPQASGATVVLDHTGFPEGKYDSLYSGWQSHYWDPLKKFLV
jgi:activator of HSP90 ATPase